MYPKGGCALLKILSDNLKLILVGLIAILMILAGAIVISLYFGGDVTRQPVITEISGSVSITRENKKLTASKNFKLKSGDIIATDKDSYLRIGIDGNKYILVEPNSTLYIYFTEVASKGDIAVNLNKGSVLCQINEKLKKKASFTVKTPNGTVDVVGTVFRVDFAYKSEYMGYNNVMITQIQNFSGTVNLQLYDIDKQPKDLPMVLVERTSAQMLTAENLCQYGYLNYAFDLTSLSRISLGELIRAHRASGLAFTEDEVNQAYKIAADEERRLETMTETTTTEETTVTTPITTSSSTETTTTAPSVTETEPPTSYDTLRTTQKTHEYTTYSGIKWWELTGNTNTGTDDYEDWFTEEPQTEKPPQETVTAGVSAEQY